MGVDNARDLLEKMPVKAMAEEGKGEGKRMK